MRAGALTKMLPLIPHGTIIGGRFEVGHLSGRGGVGSVYAATDSESGEKVALKVLHSDLGNNQARFENESRILKQISHPAVVRFLASGRSEGQSFIVMEWLEGSTLQERIEKKGLTPAEAVRMVARIASGLAEIHELGIVHRDIKPNNIVLVDGDPARAKLIDFGIAREQDSELNLTRTGLAVGTPRYMSPEQAKSDSLVRPASDVFSLGLVLFECLTGTRAFPGKDVNLVLAQIVHKPIPPLSSLLPSAPSELANILSRMLDKNPTTRFGNGRELCAELQRLVTRVPLGDKVPERLQVGIGRVERRLVSVLVAGRTEEIRETRSTLELSASAERLAALRDVAEGHSAQIDILAKGAVVAVVREVNGPV